MNPLRNFFLIRHSAQAKRRCNVFITAFVAVKAIVLEDITDVLVTQFIPVGAHRLSLDEHRTLLHLIEAADDIQKRRLTAAAPAEDCNHSVVRKIQCNVIDNMNLVGFAFIEILL